MSDEEVTIETSDGQILAAEYKDGQLQIVEVTPFEKDRDGSMLPELEDGSDQQPKYMQVLDTSKGLMQLDLLNLTLVRCQDGEESYQLVANAGGADTDPSATVTCVLQSSDTEDNQDSYMVVENESGQGSLVFLKSAPQEPPPVKKVEQPKKGLSPAEILEKAKALQKAKALLAQSRGGRKRKSDLPPPHELLASPNFKLYLYSCKLCPYKCNAIKDMSAHKAAEHAGGGARGRAGGRGAAVTLQCARCPYRGGTHSQLMKHVQDKHLENTSSNTVHLDTEEVEAADVLVCGACGFEAAERALFRAHIEDEHGATTC
ncbi:uncharacterized protein LOC113499855 isoform X4 [Trichoplusia ni]|uniref:Uncharacterized protein LOC113499855 isoform X4 n=1 Tax=Trichoplusia ni TaxID=7111 RepID=A0A7E5W7L8_TRINI|nr:uncharacterized protein LOC113499855 isoform X4 [Trichoplusia ni]